MNSFYGRIFGPPAVGEFPASRSRRSRLFKVLSFATLVALACGGPAGILRSIDRRAPPRPGRWPTSPQNVTAAHPPRPRGGSQPRRKSRLRCEPRDGGPPCPPTMVPTQPMHSAVSLCATVCNELDLPEWLDHHRRQGIGAFYLFDHGSLPPLPNYAYDALAAGDVRYEYFNNVTSGQWPLTAVYDTCIERFAHRHAWMAFIDADEYIILRQPQQTLPDLLQQFRPFGGLAINWRMFGSSNHSVRPPGRVVDNYVQCFPAHADNGRHVKVIANTAHLRGAGPDPHSFVYAPGYFAVNEKHQPVHGAFSVTVSITDVVLHHYSIKSWEDFLRKRARGEAHGGGRKWRSFFDEVNRDATELCLDARTVPVD